MGRDEMKKIFAVVLLASLLTGCASSAGNENLHKETQASIKSKIKEGVTTKAEVKGILGSPDNVSFTDKKNEIWKYEYVEATVAGESYIPFYGLFHNGMKGTQKDLAVIFNGDVVEKYTMSESPLETKTGWAD
ncbi:hypothetical protein BMI79_06005 [Serratia oryzae]|uniref:Lipoprotein SmpA/OmlA domain-containing protein n=2 Tax=Serratia oryzae TaxID=2034155 RepID=A0A1S8CMB4_9GAMM|nr:hypothetical protein BMI79_06005 [Serratia oryzae]